MVEISEVVDEPVDQQEVDCADPPTTASASASAADVAISGDENDEKKEEMPSETRLRDADELETLAKTQVVRPSARAHIDVLVAKLRREGAALQRMEASRAKAEMAAAKAPSSNTGPAAKNKGVVPVEEEKKAESNAAPCSTAAVKTTDSLRYVPIDKFAFDMGGYSSRFISLYVNLPGVGSIAKSDIQCTFTASSIDLIVTNLGGKNYRLFKDNLDKDVEAEKCKYIVKPDKIVIKLAKKKTDYGGYEHWSDLSSKKQKKAGAGGAGGEKTKSDDPTASIMDLMKDMYDNGDDQMKKMIGETMMKQRTGELGKDMPGMPGLGGAGASPFDDDL